MKTILSLLTIVIFPIFLFAQTQTVKGTVIDQQSEIPLIGATIELISNTSLTGVITDIDGRFRLENVPVGRQVFRISYLGYNTVTLPNIVVTSGKEVILDILMEESVVQMDEIVVTAEVEKDKANNEMATISAINFSLEEVTRYSGGRNDVSRLVTNFAGVSISDDSRNDIVIRGNSPTGVLWRLEGVPIPSPNHFATLGTTGGPISALNTNLLKNSDFITSAFPSEYGNATAGVFDINFRSGNRDNYEFTAQMGAFSGLEAMVEGPLSQNKKGSCVVAFRNSFIELADAVGIPVGTNATPAYRDLSFKVDFANGKAGKFSLFGIAATSDISFLGNEIDETDLFANPNEDSFADSRFGVIGLKHNYLINDRTYVRTVLSGSSARTIFSIDRLLPGEEDKLKVTSFNDELNRFAISSFINQKFNAKWTLRTGVLTEVYGLNTKVSDRFNKPDRDGDGLPDLITIRDFDGALTLFQVYTQSKYKLNEKLTLNTGLHAQYLEFNDDLAIEPRLAINYNVGKNQTLNLGYGLHHQMQPLPVFFLEEEIAPGQYERTNKDLQFTRSHHLVLGYEKKIGTDWRIRTEAYHQWLNNVAIESTPSSFSILNAGADFGFPERFSLVNEGTGRNYGVELTVEKFFSKGYYGLLTTSVFESKYKGSDGIERNTAFNNNFVFNFLAGKEIKIGKDKRNALTFDMKVTSAGGRYYTPVDLEASMLAGEEVLEEDLAYSEKYSNYFRLDAKIGFQLNSKNKKFSQQFFIDFQNLTDNKNVFVNRYNEVTNEVNTVYQSGFFPDILYRVQF